MTTNTYLIKEGYENLKKHGSKTFSTMLIICATMLVLGIFMILFTNVNKNVETVKVEQGIQAFIEDTATDADIEYIKDAIKKLFNVGTFMSKNLTFFTNVRQISLLKSAIKSLEDVEQGIKEEREIDMIEIDLKLVCKYTPSE